MYLRNIVEYYVTINIRKFKKTVLYIMTIDKVCIRYCILFTFSF